ncbi:hypothetical protein GF319_15740 [Candidatus Bathyarchaeota archaeon]|nr:hypothetical protein [Candidatus Bathyarchaeota archaeon]
MKNQYGSEWQSYTVEIMKTLHGYENPSYDKELGCIELQTEEDDEKKVLRVMIDEDFDSNPIYVKDIDETLESLEEEDIDQFLLLGKRITSASRRMMKENDDIDYLTPKTSPHYRISQLVYAIQNKTLSLCKQKCGKVPREEGDCQGIEDGNYTCSVRRISDDSTFHAEMKWESVLHEDFKKLVELEKKLIPSS